MTRRKVVVTAVGVASPVGGSAQSTFDALNAGACGIRRHPDARIERSVGYVEQDVAAGLHPGQARMLDRVTLIANYAANQALEAAALDAGQ